MDQNQRGGAEGWWDYASRGQWVSEVMERNLYEYRTDKVGQED